jgi:hypothetical protein
MAEMTSRMRLMTAPRCEKPDLALFLQTVMDGNVSPALLDSAEAELCVGGDLVFQGELLSSDPCHVKEV